MNPFEDARKPVLRPNFQKTPKSILSEAKKTPKFVLFWSIL